MTSEQNNAIKVGDRAPDFSVAAGEGDAPIRLDDYVGRAPLFLNLMRGLHCPFCRRAMTQLTRTDKELRALGMETLIVVMTPLRRAQTYFKYRPTPLRIGSDPEVAVYRSYRLPEVAITEEEDDWPRKVSLPKVMSSPHPDHTGEFGESVPLIEMAHGINDKVGYEETAEEKVVFEAHPLMLDGHFMIDRDGVVRWLNIEAPNELSEFGEQPNLEAIVAAARAMAA